MSAPGLSAQGVSFRYGRRDPLVLDRVTLSVPPGSIVGLLGPNGSGKTTLLRLLAGTLTPQTGTVALDGDSLTHFSRLQLARRIAVVPQEVTTTFDYNVLDIVMMGRYPHLGAFELEGARDLALARDALNATGCAALETRRFATLSGGEKQRVVIAAALAQASEVLLLDEPTASLDLAFQLEIVLLLERLNQERGTTIVISTHDVNLATRLCGQVVLLKQGRVLADGVVPSVITPANILDLYGIDADVAVHPRAGHLTVVPLARHP